MAGDSRCCPQRGGRHNTLVIGEEPVDLKNETEANSNRATSGSVTGSTGGATESTSVFQ